PSRRRATLQGPRHSAGGPIRGGREAATAGREGGRGGAAEGLGRGAEECPVGTAIGGLDRPRGRGPVDQSLSKVMARPRALPPPGQEVDGSPGTAAPLVGGGLFR